MKFYELKIKYLGQIIIIWTFVNLALNMVGLLLTKLLSEAEFTFIESIANEIVKPLLIQSLLFSICLLLGYIFMKNKKLSHYTFVLFQLVVFHLIFFLNLKIHHGIHFASTFHNIGIRYLSYSGQYLIDILYVYFPLNGNFENGAFMPDNIGTFYLHWILLNIVYYFALTWISIKVSKFFFENNTKIQSKIKQNTDI